MSDLSSEWHVASLVVRHHPQAIPAIAAAVEATHGLELAMQDDSRSVLLQESDGTAGLMASIDLLQALQGVLTVNLVHHHIEPQEHPRGLSGIDPQESPR